MILECTKASKKYRQFYYKFR